MSPFCTSWSMCITYAFSSRCINHSNPPWGRTTTGRSEGFTSTWEEGITSLPSRKWQGLTLATLGLSMFRASKELKIVWIWLQLIIFPPGGCQHVPTPIRVNTAGEAYSLTCPWEDWGRVQSQTLTPQTPH